MSKQADALKNPVDSAIGLVREGFSGKASVVDVAASLKPLSAAELEIVAAFTRQPMNRLKILQAMAT